MKKFIAVLLIGTFVFTSCGRRVYLNEANKITISKKKTRSHRPRAKSDLAIALLIAIPNIIFFGSTIQNQRNR
ncbi:hypothetical protein QQ008_04085 [Fulvivirgaceae bacterium BMA10]|uniref:Lipoprotein n=1 Tax=Splendidivirga corallicola TaxID=3051826 RepID=A0ABT8KLT2_9BACT|nr:hypothetical protein [Fulvivirgaceae bacterium BMA10]